MNGKLESSELRTEIFNDGSFKPTASVRVTHLPTGTFTVVTTKPGGSQLAAKAEAIRRLESLLYATGELGVELAELVEFEEQRQAVSEELNSRPVPCLICGEELEPAFQRETGTRQPYGATTFTSHGQYGSTVYDEGTRSRRYLEVNIHDHHLVEYANRGRVLEVHPPLPVQPPPTVERWQPYLGEEEDGDGGDE